MGQLVCSNAVCQCQFGAAPSTLMVLPANMVNSCNMPGANIMDNKPMVNVMPFGMCSNPSNPQVAAATAAAMGVLTPMPCVPVIAAPWAPGSAKVMLKGQPALNNSSKLMCNWGGTISVNFAGQSTVNVP